jgi:hypothetical protein
MTVLAFPRDSELYGSLSIGGIPLILVTQETRCLAKSDGIRPVKTKLKSPNTPALETKPDFTGYQIELSAFPPLSSTQKSSDKTGINY